MDRSTYLKILLGFVMVTVFASHALAQDEPSQDKQNSQPGVGRFDPFEQVAAPKTAPIMQTTYQPDGSIAAMPELFVKSVMIKFLQAANLQKVLSNMTSSYGSITTDKNSNSLIICDTQEHIDKILAEVRKADKTPKQIMVEVVILDVKLDDDTKLGIYWDILFDDRYSAAYGQYINTTWPVGDILTTSAFQIITGNITNYVYALQDKRDVEILASPRVMMVSGKSSSIEAIEEIPYLESSQSSESQTVLTYTVFKEVGIKLNVTATLTDDDEVVLKVDAEQNVQTGTSGNVPIVDTRKASSSLLLQDGQIVIMGGLRREEKSINIEQVPLLGDLPIIGGLFRGTNSVVKHSELVVFLSPHIYNNEPISEAEMEKFNFLRNRPLLELPKEEKK